MPVGLPSFRGDSAMEANTKTVVALALYYVSRGMQVIPIKPISKEAAISWKDGGLTDPEEIEFFYAKNPGYGLGILTGERSGVDVVDFDTIEAYEEAKANGLPDGPLVRTHKGYHLYCRHLSGLRGFQKRKDMVGLDLRADGGYVAAPPSVHPEGTIYQWVTGKGLDDLELPEVPEWVYVRASDEKKPIHALADGVAKGERNDALTRLVGSWIAKGMNGEQIYNEAVKWNKSCDPPDDIKVVTATVMSEPVK